MSYNTEDKSHHTEENKICPNCGSTTTGNYCYQCGQETRLHSDTLWALTTHFIGHYIHYDSKFWQTLKTLIVSPGKLTIAYWNKQRTRYLSPISLYLFVTFVFFFIVYTFSAPDTWTSSRKSADAAQQLQLEKSDSAGKAAVAAAFGIKAPKIARLTPEERAERLKTRDETWENIEHTIPKFFFFMIPLLAIVLKLLFSKRKELTIVHHTIFSFHVQTFYFLSLIFTLYDSDNVFNRVIGYIFTIAPLLYSVLALKQVYGIKTGRAILYDVIIIISYAFMLFIVFLVYYFIVRYLHVHFKH
ncbi:hypothetical protein CJD36_016375 [Flavipsychrobacter stenotrophus]|uniref:DUF3667 domain-containing protein n=2 Tax=Flavipsychrobacter stenotrophus TaxID=2077091 RepID=A0A2S7STK6_9BACT|nr:hypothetical protein CJD36_016375 [Flavipsychrobacter stenotrophus]